MLAMSLAPKQGAAGYIREDSNYRKSGLKHLKHFIHKASLLCSRQYLLCSAKPLHSAVVV
jgi:hypothetical protein